MSKVEFQLATLSEKFQINFLSHRTGCDFYFSLMHMYIFWWKERDINTIDFLNEPYPVSEYGRKQQ